MPLGTGGVSEVGHLLDYTPELVLGPARPPPGIGPHSLCDLPVPSRSSSALQNSSLYGAENCLPVPHRAASSARGGLQRFQRSAQFPILSPLQPSPSRAASLTGWLWFRDTLPSLCGTILSVLPITLFSIQEIHLSPEPTQDQENEGIPWNKTLRRSRWSWPCLRACSPSLCFVPWDSSALLWGLSPH